MTVSKSFMNLPGYTKIEESPLPIIRDQEEDLQVETSDSLPNDLRDSFGKNAGFRVLPYKMQSHYARSTKMQKVKTILLENESMRATFLPEYGGRLYSLYNKKEEKELLSVNPVFQPANLALRNAWFSGGVEWNMAHFGHTYLTCSPVYFAKCTDKEGNDFIRLYEYERVKKLFYQIDFHLRPGEDFLIAYIKIINIYEEKTPLYYWTNTAVSELHNGRVFSDANEVVYIKPYVNEKGTMVNTMAYGNMPYLEGIEGDVSYPRNFERSNEYFFQTPKESKQPWEAVAYNDGSIFYEWSSAPLIYRKMFCWGTHKGGTKWQEYLSHGSEERYVEVQAGIFPTQLHSNMMEGKSTIEFVQVFGQIYNADIEKITDTYQISKDYVKKQVLASFEDKLDETGACAGNFSHLQQEAYTKPKEILHEGDVWGGLELQRLGTDFEHLQGMKFRVEPTKEAKYWFSMLEGNYTYEESLDEVSIGYLTDCKWLPYIEKAIQGSQSEVHILQKALILSENLRMEEAIQVMESYIDEQSIKETTSIMFLRTLGAFYVKNKDYEKASKYYETAYKKLQYAKVAYLKEDFTIEYMEILVEKKEYKKLMEVYENLEDKGIEEVEEMYYPLAKAAFERKEWKVVDEIFKVHPERFREGNTVLSELWYRKKALDLGRDDMENIRKEFDPPENIDFRMVM